MTASTFTDWLNTEYELSLIGAHQDVFSKYYTEWLATEVVGDAEVHSWIAGQLAGDMLAAFQNDSFSIVMNQNSTDGAPCLDFGQSGVFSLEELFAGGKDFFSWTKGKAEQTRWYFDTFFLEGAAPPDAPDVNTVAMDDIVNNAEATAGFNITGAGEAGATVTLGFDSGIPLAGGNTVVVDGDGHWSIAVTGADVMAFGEGSETITASQTDTDGNVSGDTTREITVDTVGPTCTITDDTSGTPTGDVLFTFQFNEAVSGFDIDDITLSAGTKGTFTVVDAETCTLAVTPPAAVAR